MMYFQKVLKSIGWVVMTLLAALMFLIASRYLAMNPDDYFPDQKVVYVTHTGMLLMHIVGSMLAVVLGPFQFLEGIRKGRFLKVHRWLGRIYLLGILFGGAGGLYMAQLAYGGIVARLGFSMLGVLWLWSGAMAYWHIRQKNLEIHRAWMVRNYALTFAAVILRLWQIVFAVSGVDFTLGYMLVAWLSWVPNLVIAELFINRRMARLNLIQVAN